jgi:hypothetical protein
MVIVRNVVDTLKLGTRTATLHKDGVKKLRENWIYRLNPH